MFQPAAKFDCSNWFQIHLSPAAQPLPLTPEVTPVSYKENENAFDLSIGLIIGLVLGAIAGVLFAPKAGKETREELKTFLENDLPDKLQKGVDQTKAQAKDIADKTRQEIDTKLERLQYEKKARRLADAKTREEQETGTYDY